jgi:hypothetical protein
MRMLAFAGVVAMVPLIGCAGPEPVQVSQLTPGPGGSFKFSAATNTIMTENDDGVAEQIRHVWLAGALGQAAICRTGYAIDNRRLVQPQTGLFANGGDIVYAGHCL